MILADKIVQLRKKCGWSQEELAEKMNVSRQSISKWEGAASIPDLNKIIQLSHIFGVTTDYLLKDDITDEVYTGEESDDSFPKINLTQASAYITGKKNFALAIGRGVLLCIYSVIPLLILSIFKDEDTWVTNGVVTSLGVTLLFLMVAIAVMHFVQASRFFVDFKQIEEGKFELEYGVSGILKERAEAHLNRFYKILPLSIATIIVSMVPLIVSGSFNTSNQLKLIMVIVMFVLIGLGVNFIIITSITKEGYEKIMQEGQFSLKFKKENAKLEKFASIYWPLVVAVYLGWSFVTMNWGFTWIVWPVAALVFAGLSGFFREES